MSTKEISQPIRTVQFLPNQFGDGLHVIGHREILQLSLTAFFCSNRCPGDIILKAYDVARAMRESEIPVIGGFQTPMEKECLRLLLRGSQPVAICPARSIENMRVPREWRTALEDGRLLILSPLAHEFRRPTAKLAAERNRLVAGIAERVFIAHAAPGSKTEAFASELSIAGKPLFTLPGKTNANLLSLGAKAVEMEDIAGTKI